MNKNIKAALLSAFVLPGLGQLYKGEKLKGIIIICLVNIFLIVALFFVLQSLGPIIAASIDKQIDPVAVLETLKSRTPVARWLLLCFFGLWVYGVADSFKK